MAIFFYRHGRNLFGPMKGSDLKRLAALGKVVPEGEVKKGADGIWKSAAQFGDLFGDPLVVQPVPPVMPVMPVPPVMPLEFALEESQDDPAPSQYDATLDFNQAHPISSFPA